MIETLLKKPHEKETLQFIEDFLSTSTNQEDNITVNLFKTDVLTTLADFKQAISLLYTLDNEVKFQNSPVIKDTINKKLIDLYIITKQYNKAHIEIEKRRLQLPILKNYEYFLDVIKLKKAKNESYENEILLALEDQIPPEMRQQFLKEQLNLAIERKEYKNVTKTIAEMRKLLVLPALENELINIEAYVMFSTNDFEGLLQFESIDDVTLKTYYWLKSLIALEKYRQASIYEVEHEQEIESLETHYKKDIFENMILMYEKTNSKISVETYEKKLRKLNRELAQIEKEQKRVEKVVNTTVEAVPVLSLLDLVDVVDEKEKESNKTNNEQSYHIIQLTLDLIKVISEQNEQSAFRERIRQLFIYFSRFIHFSEMMIFIKPMTLYHYKKDRLYEKSVQINDLSKTVLGISFETLEDIVESADIIKYPLDIITGQHLVENGVVQVYSYPIGNLGSIAFYQTNEVNDVMRSDDLFKVMSMLLLNVISNERFKEKKLKSNLQFKHFFDSNLVPFRILTDHQVKFNHAGNQLFGFKKTESIDKFIQRLDGNDQLAYQNLIRSLQRKEITSATIDYGYEDKNYKETLVVNDKVYPHEIYSYLIDVTKNMDKEMLLTRKATKNSRFELLNTNAFMTDFDQLSNQKMTLIAVDLIGLEDIEVLYGKQTLDDYYYEFASLMNDQRLPGEKNYYLDDYKTLMVININDIRAVEKWLKKWFDKVTGYLSKTLKKQQYQMYCGVIRYPVNTQEKNIDKILKYLSIASNKAINIKSSHRFAYFDYNDFVDDQFETNMIRQIDEQLTNETLDVCFTEIVDMTNNRIYGYDVNVYSSEIDLSTKYFYIIASKRNLMERLEKNLIMKTFRSLNEVVKKTEKYVRLSISISAHTLKLKEFNRFIFGLYEQYQIPYHMIDLVFLMKDGAMSDYKKLSELSEAGIKIGVDHIQYTLESFTNFFHITDRPSELSERYLSLLKHQKAYLDEHKIGLVYYNVFDEKEKEKLKMIGINYIKNHNQEHLITLNKLIDIINHSN